MWHIKMMHPANSHCDLPSGPKAAKAVLQRAENVLLCTFIVVFSDKTDCRANESAILSFMGIMENAWCGGRKMSSKIWTLGAQHWITWPLGVSSILCSGSRIICWTLKDADKTQEGARDLFLFSEPCSHSWRRTELIIVLRTSVKSKKVLAVSSSVGAMFQTTTQVTQKTLDRCILSVCMEGNCVVVVVFSMAASREKPLWLFSSFLKVANVVKVSSAKTNTVSQSACRG